MDRRAPVAALAYFGIVFAVGFALGAARVTLIEPHLGPTWSVALELPVMLTVSWLVARWIVNRFAIVATATAAAVGLSGLVLLVVAEALLGLAFGQTIAAQLAAYASARGVLTIIGQLGFAAMPLLAQRAARRRLSPALR